MDMHINKDLVRTLRLEKSWSQEKLAEMANMNLRTVQRIEKDGLASLRSCAALAQVLGIPPQELRTDAASDADSISETYSPPVSCEQPARTSVLASLVPALLIIAAGLVVWSLAQNAAIVHAFDPYQRSVITFLGAFFAASVLMAFFTSVAQRRFSILAGCIVVATLMAPPELRAMAMIAIPLVVLFELSVWLAKRFGAPEHPNTDAT